MGLKSASSGSGIVGKFTGQPLMAVSSQFSSPPSGQTPELDFSQASNSMYIPLLFGYSIK